MILGYCISGNSSNDGEFFENAPEGVLCPSCGTCLDYLYTPKNIKLHPSQKYDISYTHDLRTLYSERFVAFSKDTLRCDEEFIPIETTVGTLYYMFPKRVIQFDAERRKVAFENLCELCKNFETVAGAFPTFFVDEKPIGPGFFRSDLAFASGSSKSHVTYISTEWKKEIEKQKFRGAIFEEVLTWDSWWEKRKKEKT